MRDRMPASRFFCKWADVFTVDRQAGSDPARDDDEGGLGEMDEIGGSRQELSSAARIQLTRDRGGIYWCSLGTFCLRARVESETGWVCAYRLD